MPSLDSCLSDIYEPGNIPADPGQPPAVPIPIQGVVGSASGVGTALGSSIAGSIGAASGVGAATGVADSDPNFANVVLLLGFNGTDGATTTTDESSAGHTFSFQGTSQIDTAQFKFGTSSLLCQGDFNYIRSADSADWTMTGTFTGECWVRYASASSAIQVLASHWGTGTAWIMYVKPDTTVQEARIQISTNGSTVAFSSPTAAGVDTNYAPNTWIHLAWDRDSSDVLRVYVDGAMTGKQTGATGMANVTEFFSIGGTATGNLGFSGWIDEMRLTKGVSRYGDTVGDSGFTPPIAAFPRS